MNKSNAKQKRSFGKESPLSKRPKLDFTLKTRESPKKNKSINKESPKKSIIEDAKEKVSSGTSKRNTIEITPTASDWDEDFSGDMLEKVCLIADLSQAMVNNEPVPRELNTQKVDFEIFEGSRIVTRSKSPRKPVNSPERGYESLKLEIKRLQERLKTKEGEVHILRSQLKQSEDAKQTVALQNIKVIEDIQKKYNEKISLTEKELESTKSKLLFRDLEYKTLSERCRQLEYSASKNKTSDAASSKSFCMSQVIQAKEVPDNQSAGINYSEVGSQFDFSYNLGHEGKFLAEIICPEFFTSSEVSDVEFYNFHNNFHNQKAEVNFDKKVAHKNIELPNQTVFIKDLNHVVSHLFTFNNFHQKEAQEKVQIIFNYCIEILTHIKKVLVFLEDMQLCSDYDKADQFLLQNECQTKQITLKSLIGGQKLNKEECGIEGRRSLALIYAIMKTSSVSLKSIRSSIHVLELLKSLATLIGTLRTPLTYNGILVGITLILQKILEEEKLPKEFLLIISETLEEIIFSRPKLDVLLEVVRALTAGKHHFDFVMSLCRKDSADSCTLYMDCKLKQAMFFTKNTCPLKLLCLQIMGLASMPSSNLLKWVMTHSVIKWLNSSINTPFYKKIEWLPINSISRPVRCFNVTECLLYLLTQCLKDYLEIFSRESGVSKKADLENKKLYWISIIGEGSVIFKRILKADQRHLHDNSFSLRFAMLLKSFLPSKSDLCQKTHLSSMTSLQVEAITWITDLVESVLRNQDCCLKQNTTLPDLDFFSSLKIKDEPKIN